MKRSYLTPEGMPVKTNCPQENWKKITEEEYKRICKERNDKIEAEQAKLEEEMKPIRERRAKIQQRMYEIAEQQLIEEGEIS